jgi:hypothetical protein
VLCGLLPVVSFGSKNGINFCKKKRDKVRFTQDSSRSENNHLIAKMVSKMFFANEQRTQCLIRSLCVFVSHFVFSTKGTLGKCH